MLTSPSFSIPPPLPPIHRRLFLSLTPLLLPLLPLSAHARGLFQMPPARLTNRYFLVRAGESKYESDGIVNTNPVAKTSVDSGLSPEGARQAYRSALELQKMGACDGSCWIWPSITQRSYQAAEIIASVNGVDRSRIVPEYSFLDARGLGAFEGRKLDSTAEGDTTHVYLGDPVFRRHCSHRVARFNNLSILQAGLIGLDLRRHRDLFFGPGEVRPVDPKSIPKYKQPASAVYKCINPPSCT